jgi:RHS repeat-associated protein
MLPASSHLKPVIGVDFHTILTPPSPVPVPLPYVGIVVDPADYIPFLGSTVLVNNIHRGCGFTAGRIGCFIHLPKTALPNVGHESVTFFASLKVEADGNMLAPAGYMVMTCNDVGIPMSLSVGKGSWKPKLSLFAPTSASIPVSYGPPVIVGGPYVPDIKGWLMQLAFSAGFSYAFKSLKVVGTAVNKLLKKGNTPFTDALSSLLCKLGLEPVDLITGRVLYEYTDFELPGPVPLKWTRIYHSDSRYSGPLGHGQHHAYDVQLIADTAQDMMYVVLPDGRPAFFSMLAEGEEEYNRSEKLTLKRTAAGYSLHHHPGGLSYHFVCVSEGLFRPHTLASRAGHAIRFHYNGSGHLHQLTDSAGRTIHLTLDHHHRIQHIEARYKGYTKKLVSYSYNEEGDLTVIKDALEQPTLIDYQNHLMVKKTDRNGQAFYWAYDKQNRCTHSWGDGGILEGWLTYHKDHSILTNSLGAKTTYYFDAYNRPTRTVNPEGHSSYTHYTPHSELLRTIDEDGNITGYRYDDRGNTTAVMLPTGAQVHLAYNEDDRLIVHTDPEGAHTTFTYNEDTGLPEARIPATASPVLYSYNEQGLLCAVMQQGKTITLEYDEQYNLTAATLPDGRASRWVYDPWGRCLTHIQPSGALQTFTYDELDRLVRTALPDYNAIRLRYNAYDEVVQATDDKHDVRFAYTPLGSLKLREEKGATLRFSYNTEEQLTAVINEKGERYRFRRNAVGAIVQEAGFDGLTRRYQRSPGGRVLRIDRPGNRYTEYEYDNAGRILRAEYSDGSWETYGYDLAGRLTSAENQTSSLKLVRNEAGQVVEEGQDGHLVQSAYDDRGNRIAITSSLGAAIALKINEANGQVQSMSASQSGGEAWQAQLQYNSLGLELERLMTGGVKNSWQYDEAGRPIEQQVSSGGRTSRHRRYSWGVNDKLRSIQDRLGNSSIQYEYDGFDNLVSALEMPGFKAEHYFRDEVGNIFNTRDKKDRKYGAGGRLEELNGTKYYYDEEGFLKYKDEKAAGGGIRRWAFEWCGNGMMKKVRRPDGKIVSFEYDALGRRTAKLFEGQITRWVWDGNTPIHEWKYSIDERPKTVVDELGLLSKDKEEPINNLTTWVFDEGSFRPAAKITDEERYSIINDHLGTPKEAYDSSGRKVWECELSAYGKVKQCSDSSFIPFRFQGQYEDTETGLYYNRFRYYSPEEAMYVTAQDPIGLDGGDRLYAYVYDPNGWLDIFGLDACSKAFKKKNALTKRWVSRLTGKNADEVEAMMLKKGFVKSHPQAAFPDKIQHTRYTRTTKSGSTQILDYHPGGNSAQPNVHGNDYWKVYTLDASGNEVVNGRIGHSDFKAYDLITDSPVYVDGALMN